MEKTDEREPPPREFSILLADDDKDDCLFFKEALKELDFQIQLTIVPNGDQLMQLLTKKSTGSFDVLFLDLNMPRKNGFECLEAIKRSEQLKSLPVIIFSTSYDQSIADLLYKNGALHYICKPADFSELRNILQQALIRVEQKDIAQPPKEKFLLNSIKAILR